MDAEVRGYSIDDLAAIFAGEFTVEEIREHLRAPQTSRLRNDDAIATESTAVFVAGINWTTSQERLREFFSSCGDIRHAHLAVERSGRSRGFGKVVFTTPQAASLALKLNGQRLDGRPLTVRSFATSPNTPRRGHEVFIESLSWSTKEGQLRRHFAACGEILSCEVFYSKTGEPKGRAKLRFAQRSGAQAAVEMHLSDLDGWTLAVRVAQESLAPALPVVVERPVPGSCVQLAQCSGVELLERIPAELIIKEWLQSLEPMGFLLCYLPKMLALGHPTVRGLSKRYIRMDTALVQMDWSSFFEDLRMVKLGHQRLIQRYFADLSKVI